MGNNFKAYYATGTTSLPTGLQWIQIGASGGQTVNMGTGAKLVGLAVTSHVSGTIATATFKNVDPHPLSEDGSDVSTSLTVIPINASASSVVENGFVTERAPLRSAIPEDAFGWWDPESLSSKWTVLSSERDAIVDRSIATSIGVPAVSRPNQTRMPRMLGSLAFGSKQDLDAGSAWWEAVDLFFAEWA